MYTQSFLKSIKILKVVFIGLYSTSPVFLGLNISTVVKIVLELSEHNVKNTCKYLLGMFFEHSPVIPSELSLETFLFGWNLSDQGDLEQAKRFHSAFTYPKE